jgi:hypothetical protein
MGMVMAESSRRQFLASAAAGFAVLFFTPRRATAHAAGSLRGPHPTPRPGITGANVLTKEQLADTPEFIPLFDGIRAIPEIADGIRCNCGCAGLPGYYSLLSCYEGDGMARSCLTCEGQGRVTTRLHAEGKTLDEIRVAIDAQFG